MTGPGRDIVFAAGGASLRFAHLAWDTEFFGRPSYALDSAGSAFGPAPAGSARDLAAALDGAFVTAKLGADVGLAPVHLLEEAGFRLVDTEIVLALRGSGPAAEVPAGVEVAEAGERRDLPCVEFGESFSLTRFHVDPRIGPAKAGRLWAEYLANFTPGPDDRMFLALAEGRPAGVVLTGRREGRVDVLYVAVLAGMRGRGVGSALLRRAAAAHPGEVVCTATQARNVRALDFYIANGFSRVLAAKTVLHRW